MRLTSKQTFGVKKDKALNKEATTNQFKIACHRYQHEKELEAQAEERGDEYIIKTATSIVDEINVKEGVTLSARTVRKNVQKGKVGQTPRKGRRGSIPMRFYKALLGAVESYIKLAQQEGKKKITRKRLSTLLEQSEECSRKFAYERAREPKTWQVSFRL